MPAKTRQPAASTLRVRQTRARKKISKLREDNNWLVFAIQQFYLGHDVPLSFWVKAEEIYDAPGIGKEIPVSILLTDKSAFFRNLQNSPALETAVLRFETQDITLVRPRFLQNEVLGI